MKRIIIPFLALSVLLWAGEYGRIVGRVIDVATNQPMIGANVIILGTELGASTGSDGSYVILYISPGSYTLKATSIGYDSVIVKNVIVNADQTAKQDFRLKETVIALPPTVVSAVKPLVTPTTVTTTRIQTKEDIERTPVINIPQLIGLTAGVTRDAQGSHFRGGRPDEVTYYIDGMAARVPHTGTEAVNIAKSAVEEVSIMPGGFEAEYGEALSGVVNIITKEGGDKIEAMMRYTTDEMFQTDKLNYGYNFYEGYFGGAIPGLKQFRYFLSGEVYKVDDYGPDNGLGYFRVDRPRLDYKGEGRFTYKLPLKGKLSVSGYNAREQFNQYTTSFHFNLPNYVSRTYKSSFLNSGLNYLIGKYTQASIKASYLQIGRFIAVRDTLLENHPEKHRDSLRYKDQNLQPREWWEDYRYKGQWIIEEDPVIKEYVVDSLTRYYTEYNPQTTENPYGSRGLFYVGDYRMWEYYFSTTYTGKADIIHSIGRVHEFKTGATFSYSKLGDWYNSLPWDPLPFYDLYSREPYSGSAYIQDRVDWGGMILRAGLRFDYLDANAMGVSDPYDSTTWVYAKPTYRISPRLGFSFPITDRIKFRFNYGHFFQTPPLDNLYSVTTPTVVAIAIRRGNQILGNPEMQSKKTIQYEFGFENQISDVFSFDLTAYFRDIYDLETVREVIALPMSYFQMANADYGNVKGFEFGLTKRLLNYWSGRISYTLQYAKGTGSYAWESYYDYYNAAPDPVTGTRPPVPAIDFWLDFDERHMVVTDLGLSFPKDFVLLPLRDFDLSTVTTYHSGQPYTPTNIKGERIGDMNSARKPGYINTDLRASKDVPIGPLDLGLNCTIYNLFNTEQVREVYASSGEPDWDNADPNYSPSQLSSFTIFSTYYHPACDMNHNGICSNTERYIGYMDARHFQQKNPNNYMPSFRIRFGASIKI